MPMRVRVAGKRFGRAVVMRDEREDGSVIGTTSNRRAVCVCDCGTVFEASVHDLRRGHVRSCGCLHRDVITVHGTSDHQLYAVLKAMVRRCEDSRSSNFATYGGRGIRVCDEWRGNPRAFIAWSEAHGWAPGLQIDRIDNERGYEPANCRFVSCTRNMRNKRCTFMVTFDGDRVPLCDLCERMGVSFDLAYQRIRKLGWNVADAVSVRKRRAAA